MKVFPDFAYNGIPIVVATVEPISDPMLNTTIRAIKITAEGLEEPLIIGAMVEEDYPYLEAIKVGSKLLIPKDKENSTFFPLVFSTQASSQKLVSGLIVA